MFRLGLVLVIVSSCNCIVIRPQNGSSKVIYESAPSEQDDDRLRLLDYKCLECICQATSGCSQNVRCRKEGAVFCGPFFISKLYWDEAGRPGLRENVPLINATQDFIECANERFCSETIVRGYMKRYASDCNGDGVVTCHDFALIHKNGPTGCKKAQNREGAFYSNFLECYALANSPPENRKYAPIIPR